MTLRQAWLLLTLVGTMIRHPRSYPSLTGNEGDARGDKLRILGAHEHGKAAPILAEITAREWEQGK